jgi:colanic acid/amylovoran biosynthesis glycosyltransferase
MTKSSKALPLQREMTYGIGRLPPTFADHQRKELSNVRLGYLVPEFPSQTHIFFWREVQALRQMGVEVVLVSTRKPAPLTCRHDFASAAIAETRYLFPPRVSYQASWMAAGCRGLPQMLAYLRKLKTRGPKNRMRQIGLLAAAIDLVEWSRRQRIDHIHGHSCANTAHILAMARRAGGSPYSLTLHGDLEVYGADHRLKMGGAAFVFTVGNHLRQQVMMQAGVPSDRVFVTCMGVKTTTLADLGKHRSYTPGSLHLVTVARLHPAKGHMNALSAVQRGLQNGLNLRYTIAGDGPYRDVILSRVAELGLKPQVTLTGTLSETEVYELLSAADAFVLPSVGPGEAWPVSVMEAMGAGLPVIASAIGATPEMITSGVDGLLVEQGNDRALFAAIVALTRDVNLRLRLGEAARRTASRSFDVTATAAILLDAVCSSLSKDQSNYTNDAVQMTT